MKKTVYLHIGTKKTGTTSLQKILGANREKILSHGYYYPKVGIPHSTQGQHMLAWAMLGQEFKTEPVSGKTFDLRTIPEDLLLEIKSVSAENIILSSEYFSEFLEFRKIEAVKTYLSGFEVKILLCLRQQDQYMLSLYAEAVKAGYSKDFLTFFEQKKHLCDYAACIARWEQVFGEGSVSIQLFKGGSGNQLLKEFFELIALTDLDINDLKLSSRKFNISPPGKLIKLMRNLNFLTKDVLSLPLSVRRNLYLYHLQQGRMMKLFSRLPDFPVSDRIMTGKASKSIQAEFASVNREIADRYFPDKNGVLFT